MNVSVLMSEVDDKYKNGIQNKDFKACDETHKDTCMATKASDQSDQTFRWSNEESMVHG